MTPTEQDKSIGGIMSKDEQIYRLWNALDDIDTALDMFKDDYKGFAIYTALKLKHAKRVVPTEKVEELYDKYYLEDEKQS